MRLCKSTETFRKSGFSDPNIKHAYVICNIALVALLVHGATALRPGPGKEGLTGEAMTQSPRGARK